MTNAKRSPHSTAPATDDALSVQPGSGAFFDAIADRYDLLNRIISLGIDQRWRRLTVEALGIEGSARVLDVATGTGDLAFEIARRLPEVEVVGLDPSVGMLSRAREKGGAEPRVTFVEGDAQALPLPDDAFDAITMAFGIRNVPDRTAALREMARVGRPGARVAILELSEPRGILGPAARFHVHKVVPTLGAWLSGASEYRYLERSIAAFPPAEEFAETMERAGLEMRALRPLTFGVCTLYVAEVPS